MPHLSGVVTVGSTTPRGSVDNSDAEESDEDEDDGGSIEMGIDT